MKKCMVILFLAAFFMLFFSACGENQESVLKKEESESATVQRDIESVSVNSESEFQSKEEDRETEAETTLEAQEEKDGYYRTVIDEEESENLIDGGELVDKALSKWSAKGDNDYYLCSESSSRLILEKELTGFSKYELWLIRNEIAARHGCVFEDPILQSYFDTQKWYEPVSGQYETTELNDIEKANLTMIDEVQSREQAPVDYHRLEQFTELAFGETYEFHFGDTEIILRPSGDDWVELLENGEKVAEYSPVGEYGKLLIFNRKDESYLIFAGMYRFADITFSECYLLNRGGVTYDGGNSGEVVAYTRDALCMWYEETLLNFNDKGHVWDFLQGDRFISKGKAVTEIHEYRVEKEFTCYEVGPSGFTEVTVYPGEILKPVNEDYRQHYTDEDYRQREADEDYWQYSVFWSEIIRNDKRIILPLYYYRGDEMCGGVGITMGAAPAYLVPVESTE